MKKLTKIAGPSLLDFSKLVIGSPKRTAQAQQAWDGFFPYYAGYPQQFARALLDSAGLPKGAVVFDPWNGSGTTTFSASQLGLPSFGFDLNPVMIIVARARLLPPSEADSIQPLIREIVKGVRSNQHIDADDPLLWWFEKPSATVIRAIERRICQHLIGERTLTPDGVRLDNISGLASTFYVALFAVCRQLTIAYRSSNPTWLRKPKAGEALVRVERDGIIEALKASLADMERTLAANDTEEQVEHGQVELRVADTTVAALPRGSVDVVLTSPPYCTRIDYSAATRIELAVLHPLVDLTMEGLGRRMIGSTRVPQHPIVPQPGWGRTCRRFLREVKAHPSKASDGYYYKTHLDYFAKMGSSLANIAGALRPGGAAILVVQDSYYKDIHNDLPGITVEMCAEAGLRLRRRQDFFLKRSLADINPRSQAYERAAGAVEAVLCFEREV